MIGHAAVLTEAALDLAPARNAAKVLAGWAGHAPAGGKGTAIELDGLKSTTPSSWKVEEPDPKLGKFRIHQFRLPRADGDKEDAELVVFFFGPGGGGACAREGERAGE